MCRGRVSILIASATALGLLLSGCRSDIQRQAPGAFEFQRGAASRTYHYLVWTPPGHGVPRTDGQRWPLLLYLPGSLTFGTDTDRLASGDPPEEIERGRDLPMVVISVMTPSFLERWNPDVLLGLIDHAIARYDVDPDRVILSGVCLGGCGVWDMLRAYPERIAGAVPLCAWGSAAGLERAADVPVWAFHGALDFVVPIPGHQSMVNAHRAAGGETRWTVYPRSMHWIWADVYARDDLYAWMLAQRRSGARATSSRYPGPARSPSFERRYARGSEEVRPPETGSGAGTATRTGR